MSRNVNSFFSENPVTMDMSRSKFERNQNIKTTMNAGSLVPFYIDEVLPGDSMSIDTSQVIRMSTLISPIMDNIYCDTYYFFVPNRLVWEHWKNFMGENTQSAWIPQVSYSIPQLTAPSTGWYYGTLADYFGIPINVGNISVSQLPFRAYGLIYNEWFRDENLVDPAFVPVNDANISGANNTTITKGGYPVLVAKYHDYFTSCLPAPQKGPDVPLPLGQLAPVYSSSNIDNSAFNTGVLRWKVDGGTLTNDKHLLMIDHSNGTDYATGVKSNAESSTSTLAVSPINLMADLTAATGTSINQLREAFQVQKLYEKDALGGKVA